MTSLFLELDHGATGCVDAALQCKTDDAVCVSGMCSCQTNEFLANSACNQRK